MMAVSEVTMLMKNTSGGADATAGNYRKVSKSPPNSHTLCQKTCLAPPVENRVSISKKPDIIKL